MKFTDLLDESINDKYLFKAIFLAGGSGSGKSFINKLMFGGIGAKVLNSDDIFEKKLKANNIPMDINPAKEEQFKKQMELRGKAKDLTKMKQNNFINGMLPIIIDGTGKDYKKIVAQKKALENMGYETGMVFVNTSLSVALERNAKRTRSVPEKVATTSWKDVQQNIGKFQNEFKTFFKVVDNNEILDKNGLQNLGVALHRDALKFFNSPLMNKVGISTIELLKMFKGKYLADLPSGVIIAS